MFGYDKLLEMIVDSMSRDLIPSWVLNLLDGGDIITKTSTVISDALTGPAILIALLFFLLSLVELGMSERMNIEMFVKFFAKFVAAFVLINSTQIIISNVETAAGWIDTEIQNADVNGDDSDAGEDVTKGLEKTLSKLSWWERALCFISTYLMKVVSFVALFFLVTLFISRKLELAVRGAFMSLAMAFVVQDGWNSGAVRYIKKYIALWLQGPAIAIVLKLSTSVYLELYSQILGSSSGLADFTTDAILAPVVALMLPIGMTFAIIGACRGTMQIVNDAMGV